MTNKEKAQELKVNDVCCVWNGGCPNVYHAAIEMAEWKDKQIIEYFYKNIQSLLKDCGVSEAPADIATQLFLANFKKAMEE